MQKSEHDANMSRIVTCFALLMFLASGVAVAQSAPPRKDIPSIAKAANGSIVSILMSDASGKPIAQGTGFIVTKDGLILTNYHVIAVGSSAVAKLTDGTIYNLGGVVASDKARDVALVKTAGIATNFRTLILGNSDRVEVGQEVVAIGNPLSLESTVSNGIVSGIRTEDDLGGKFLQVTAPISPGSSGGPLFNMSGEVIGITTLYLKGGENLNFAIPINDAKRLLVNPPCEAFYGFFNCIVQDWPNEVESSKGETHESEVPPSASTTTSAPDLKTTVEFMNRLVEPEHRIVLGGALEGAILHSSNGPAVTIVSQQNMTFVLRTGETYKKGYPEFTYSIYSDDEEQKDYPRYMSFALGDIDPSSIETKKGGYDPHALAEFRDKHPQCEANPECAHEYLSFFDSAPRLTVVAFHTTDLKPLIERGGCSQTSDGEGQRVRLGCSLTASTGHVVIFFQDKDRAERFVTALTYAVKSAGGKPDLFPPTHYSKKD